MKKGTPIIVPLANSLNDLTSSRAARLAALDDRLPGSIVLLLLVSALLATMLAAREQGAADAAELVGTVCFIAVVALAVYVTLDLNQPERGAITVSEQPMRRLLDTMAR